MTKDSAARCYPRFLSDNPDTLILAPLFIISICIKILLFPTYRSTDFDVHRNWLAITHQLPLSEWYFDNVNGTTVHTLDYPPNFAYFEWILANNPITLIFLPENDRCLQLLPDSDNDPSDACVVLQRSTVIVSDIILWIGAYIACHAMNHKSVEKATISFLLIVFNPGLLWLDHVHFQYNGMMLGILLASLGFLMRGNNATVGSTSYHVCHLTGAALYAILVNFKHLYLPLGPLYLFYLLKTYCLDPHTTNHLLTNRFLMLASITAATLLTPWIPFLLQENPKEQILQILSRLFPFGRGLVHDYWAANVWALYLLADKVVRFLSGRIPFLPFDHLPEPSPVHCALLLLISLFPGLYLVWTRPKNNVKLIQAFVYCSLCAFMLAYHVHEKAILTALLPMTLLVEHDDGIHNFFFTQVSIFGLLGLFPLLFRPVELAFKLVSYVLYLASCSSFLSISPPLWARRLQYLSYGVVLCTVTLLEFLPIQGRFEFLPLMVTSTVCAVALVLCWVGVLYTSYSTTA